MQRRVFLSTPLLTSLPAWAHHGWSSFDQARPIYLEGTAAQVAWRNPHAELKLDLPAGGLQLPADLASRKLPTRKDRRWEIELAPLSRMQAWGVPEIEPAAALALLGFTFNGEKGDAVLRVEYLWLDGKTCGRRSSPACALCRAQQVPARRVRPRSPAVPPIAGRVTA